MIYHSWLYSPEHSLESLIPNATGNSEGYWQPAYDSDHLDGTNSVEDPNAMKGCRRYLERFKYMVNRTDGNEMKLTKFHQQLHYVRQILKDGSLLNIDGGRGESNAIPNSKKVAKLTQKRARTLNWQAANNLSDNQIVRDAIAYYENAVVAPQTTESFVQKTSLGSSFRLFLESPNNINGHDGRMQVMIKWKNKPSSKLLDTNLCNAISKRLYLNLDEGGCLMHSSKVIGFTEYKIGDHKFRAHPSYRGGSEWHDWAMLRWEHLDQPIPAKICMFIDLKESQLMTNEEHNRFRRRNMQRTELNESDNEYIPNSYQYLTRGKWMVVQSALAIEDHGVRVADEFRIPSKLSDRYYLEHKWRILPIESIEGPAYCFPVTSTVNKTQEDIVSFKTKDEWIKTFIR